MEILKSKLSSRKLWAAILTVVLSIAVMIGGDAMSAEVIEGLKCAAAAAVAYIFGESAVDVSRKYGAGDGG